MAELVDALDLGSSAARREGSSPFSPTRNKSPFGDFLIVIGDVVELVDTLASGASESNLVKVQVLSSPPGLD
jgi:hypothetical protein